MEVIKTARKRLEKFKIGKVEELEQNLLRARIRFLEDLSNQEVETIKVAIKNKEEIEEFSTNLEQEMELDKKKETECELYDLSIKKELKQVK